MRERARWFMDGSLVCYYGKTPEGDWLIHFGKDYNTTRAFSRESLKRELYYLKKEYIVMTEAAFVAARMRGEIKERQVVADI